MRLSERLKAVAGQVRSGGTVADIGCDHGLTGIYLVEQGLAEHVVAMDINEEPLRRARENINRHQLSDRIEVRRSDGVAELAPGEADTLLISGMGGILTCQILEAAGRGMEEVGELVLSPQSDHALVRHFILEHGFCIDRERMLTDQGKYYLVIHAVPGEQRFDREEEYRYGRYLIGHSDPYLQEFLRKEEKRICQVLQRLSAAELSEKGMVRRTELEEELQQVRWARKAASGG